MADDYVTLRVNGWALDWANGKPLNEVLLDAYMAGVSDTYEVSPE